MQQTIRQVIERAMEHAYGPTEQNAMRMTINVLDRAGLASALAVGPQSPTGCPHDTDGDGNCHLCARGQMVCPAKAQ